jgi:hypothetical protein
MKERHIALVVDGRIVLEYISKKWAEEMWLRIGTRDGLL